MSLLLLFNPASAFTGDDVWLKALAGTNNVVFSANGGTTVATWTNALSGTAPAALALKRDVPNNTVELFVNGVSKGVLTYTVAFPAGAQLRIGATATGKFFGGPTQHVVAREGTTTAAEVAAVYEANRYRMW